MKISKAAFFFILIFFIGGIGGVFMDHYILPHLAATRLFSKYDFLRQYSEGVTVINRTEQVLVKEDASVEKISSQVASSMVNILSYKKMDAKNGTGVIATSDGLIMTYASAIIPDATYKVTIFDGRILDAQFLGIDSYSNLAFLKVATGDLPVISFSNSDDAKSGEKIIAIGNSLGFYSNQYASGLLQEFNPEFNLSGMAVASSEKMAGVFKADFNSPDKFAGGPIVDYAGGVIGLVGSVEQNNQEISFQIPSNKIKKVIERAIQKDFTANPKLGIYYLPIDQSQKISRGLSVGEGALIFSLSGQQGLAIIAGSPAQKAGLKINDIIIAINGEAVTLQKSLPDILYQYRSGNEIELTILRDGQEIKQKVQL